MEQGKTHQDGCCVGKQAVKIRTADKTSSQDKDLGSHGEGEEDH